MPQYLSADAMRANVQRKLQRLAAETGDEALTTLGVLDALCAKIARLSNREGGDDPTDIAVRTDFADELLDWVAARQGLVDELIERGATDAIIHGAMMAQYDAFVGFQGRACQACAGDGCPRCHGLGYFSEPEAEQIELL